MVLPPRPLGGALNAWPGPLCLDAGHGGVDPGATANSLREADCSLRLVREIATACDEWPGAWWVWTRHGDDTVGIRQRLARVAETSAALLLSCHCNAAPSTGARGIEVYHAAFAPRGTAWATHLAEAIAQRACPPWAMRAEPVRPDTASARGRLGLLRRSRPPAALVEAGFLTHAADAALWRNPDAVAILADACAAAAATWFSGTDRVKP